MTKKIFIQIQYFELVMKYMKSYALLWKQKADVCIVVLLKYAMSFNQSV